jgi:uncharacterized phage protein (TIGR02220 family)
MLIKFLNILYKKPKDYQLFWLYILGQIIKNVIEFLNNKTNKNFTTKSSKTISCINSRLKEGFIENDFIKVIEIKTEKWLGTSMEEYLRPITLFGNKFDSYLNETNKINKGNERFAKTQSAVDRAKQVDWFNQG